VLIDSGSTRSIISDRQLQLLKQRWPKVKTSPSDVTCVTASGENLDILGEVQLIVKIQGFSWNWSFLVSRKLQGVPILGADFLGRTQMILDFSRGRLHFGFAPREYVRFLKDEGRPVCLQVKDTHGSLSKIKCGEMSVEQKDRLEKIISQYPEVLTEELGLTHLLEYEIQLLDHTPVRSAPYRLSPPKMQYLRKHVNKLLEEGVIENSSSHYSSPMFLVPKPDGEFRAVVDFRALNKRIAIESVPLPEVHEAFHWFAKARYFTLDLNQVYHQIPLAERSKHLTAFCTDWNLYNYKRVPFGLATGAQVLTRLLDKVFHDVKFEFIYHYLDEVIYSEDFESHLKHLKILLERLKDAGLTVKPSKVVFATREISFLGHRVSSA
jgi:hypothetical protein